jgi:hypothetical protein
MHAGNRLKLGLFGANCSSGRAVTKVPERWSGTWPDNLRLARTADAAGIDFLLPIGRWKGYGGETDYQGATLETITWATALLAATRRITCFGTVHAPLFHPIIAAKEMVTADQIGEGRFGLNIVVGWNEDEFEMFGVAQRDHDARYDYAQEWIDAIKLIWSEREDFDFAGRYINLKGVRAKPKPYGDGRPIIMNAGASPTGQAFAVKNCDAFFMQASRVSVAETAERGRGLSPPLHRGSGRLGGGRPAAGDAQYHPADGFGRRVCQAAEPVRPWQQRIADHWRSRPRGAAAHRSELRGAHRHCRVAGELCRRAALPLRRSAAAVGAGGTARTAVTPRLVVQRHAPEVMSPGPRCRRRCAVPMSSRGRR